MSRNDNNKAEPVELPDDTKIAMGANYGLPDPCTPLHASGEPIDPAKSPYRYFAAANDNDPSRPDGVARCKAQGYEVCTEEKILSTDCVLMRMPKEKWERQHMARIRAAKRAALTEGNTIQGLPEESTWRSDEHSRIHRAGK